ncbi:hypothetical protein ACSBR2_040770 [Camellia fascicularis]
MVLTLKEYVGWAFCRLVFDDVWKHTCKSRSSVELFFFPELILSCSCKSRLSVDFFYGLHVSSFWDLL